MGRPQIAALDQGGPDAEIRKDSREADDHEGCRRQAEIGLGQQPSQNDKHQQQGDDIGTGCHGRPEEPTERPVGHALSRLGHGSFSSLFLVAARFECAGLPGHVENVLPQGQAESLATPDDAARSGHLLQIPGQFP